MGLQFQAPAEGLALVAAITARHYVSVAIFVLAIGIHMLWKSQRAIKIIVIFTS